MEDITGLGELLPRFLIEILAAIICGGLIGLERGLHHKSAGLRTNILICMGAVLYMIISEILTSNTSGGVSGDLTRIAGQVVTGIGFIGAGVIIHHGSDVSGLTTAATIWVVAAIGLIIGAGYPLLGMLVTAIVLLMLTSMHTLEKQLVKKPKSLLLKLTIREDNPEIRGRIKEILENYGVKPEGFRVERGTSGMKMTVTAAEEPEDLRLLVTGLWTVQGVTEVEH